MKKTFIYCLIDPRDNIVKYIGKSNNPHKRYKEHLCESIKNHKTKKERWICKLCKLDLKPILNILKEVDYATDEEYKYWEEFYIKQYKTKDFLNYDDKGIGNSGSKISTEKIRKKLSKKVYQYSLKGEFVNEYSSVREAGRILKINHGNIIRVCNKIFKHSGGFIFSYDKNESFEEIKNPNGIKKCVVEIDINGNVIKKYKSIAEAARATNTDYSNVSRVCGGKLKKTKNKIFKFENV